MIKRLNISLFFLMILTIISFARDNGQWNNISPNVRKWFQNLMQPDQPYMSCCGEADAFEADNYEVEGDHYIAIITDGRGIIKNGTRISVPNKKIKWDSGNPTGHGIIFLNASGITPRLGEYPVYCYVTPGGV